MESLVTGGQLGNFPGNTVVEDLPTVMAAVRAFYETGSRDDSLPWQEE
jgi:hypothetical protein